MARRSAITSPGWVGGGREAGARSVHGPCRGLLDEHGPHQTQDGEPEGPILTSAPLTTVAMTTATFTPPIRSHPLGQRV